MSICVNCGQELADGMQFCANCGTDPKGTTSSTQRETVYEGKIHKCPNCGEVLQSFVAICPACGFELNEKQTSHALREFIARINEYESLIANGPQNKMGWSSWSTSKRIVWIVLNILLACIPLVIYFVWPLITIKTTPKLSAEEKQMASLIENSSFPNDRESILSALVFAKEKIDFISKETINRKTAYWMRLWCAKAEQLKQKAELLFPNDPIVKESYAEIIADETSARKTIRMKAVLGCVILIFVIGGPVFRYGVWENIDHTDYSATFEWQTIGLFRQLPQPDTNNGRVVFETENQIDFDLYNISSKEFESYVRKCREEGFSLDMTKTDIAFCAYDKEGYALDISYDTRKNVMQVRLDNYFVEETYLQEGTYEILNVKNFTFSLPDYWVEEGSKNEYLQYYAEKGETVVMLSIAYPKETDDAYDVSFDGLYADNENMIEAIGDMFTDGDVIDYEVFESDYDVKGILYRFSFTQKIGLLSKADGNGYYFCFPSEDDRRWFSIVFMQTNNVDDDKYKDDYMTLLSAIRKKA